MISSSIMGPFFGILRVKWFQITYGILSTRVFEPGTTLWISRTFCTRTDNTFWARNDSENFTHFLPAHRAINTWEINTLAIKTYIMYTTWEGNRNEIVKLWHSNELSPKPVLNKKVLLMILILNWRMLVFLMTISWLLRLNEMTLNWCYSKEKHPIKYQLVLGLLHIEDILIGRSVAGIVKWI